MADELSGTGPSGSLEKYAYHQFFRPNLGNPYSKLLFVLMERRPDGSGSVEKNTEWGNKWSRARARPGKAAEIVLN